MNKFYITLEGGTRGIMDTHDSIDAVRKLYPEMAVISTEPFAAEAPAEALTVESKSVVKRKKAMQDAE